MAMSIRQLLLGVAVSINSTETSAMDCYKEIVERNEESSAKGEEIASQQTIQQDKKLLYFYDRGVEVASQIEAQLVPDAGEAEFDHSVALKEILAEISETNEKNASAYARIYAIACIDTMANSGTRGLLFAYASNAGTLKKAQKIRAEWNIQRYQGFLDAVRRLKSVTSLYELRHFIHESIQRDFECNQSKLFNLLGYYFEFGRKYGSEYILRLLTGAPIDRIGTVNELKDEYRISCGMMFRILDSHPLDSPICREAWACVHAFSKGVLQGMKIADVQKHLNEIEQKRGVAHGAIDTKLGYYKAKLNMVAGIVEIKPVAAVCSLTRCADRSRLNADIAEISPLASVLNNAGVPRCAEGSLAKARFIVDDYLKKMASISKSKLSSKKALKIPEIAKLSN